MSGVEVGCRALSRPLGGRRGRPTIAPTALFAGPTRTNRMDASGPALAMTPRSNRWFFGPCYRNPYRGRNVVERCFARLKQQRSVATRYDKRALNYRAWVVIASLLLWLDA